jgi:multiple antibiotic resistance protein
MNELVQHALTVFMGFFAIMNPIANTPIFLGLTEEQPANVRRRVAMKAVLTAFILVVIFALLGKVIFQLFGITLPAFRIMGGILVALIGYQMLHGRQSPVHHLDGKDQQASLEAALGIAVTPLAIPILAGPGTIATAMNYASTRGSGELLITVAAFALLCFITYVFFIYGDRLVRYLGPAGIGVITRIMGLILAVIGVQMLIAGVAGAIKANLS